MLLESQQTDFKSFNSFIVVNLSNNLEMSSIMSTKQGGIVTQYENTNFSTAKQKFSFGKGPRFPSVRKQDTELTYTLPSGFGNRAPSFGIGDRFDHLHWNRKPFTLPSLNWFYSWQQPITRIIQAAIGIRSRELYGQKQGFLIWHIKRSLWESLHSITEDISAERHSWARTIYVAYLFRTRRSQVQLARTNTLL